MQGPPKSSTVGPRSGDRTDEEASQRTSEASDTLRERAADVAGTAGERATHVVDTAREHTREVAGHAVDEARGVMHEAVERLRQEAEQQTHTLQQGLATAGSQLEALADGRIEEAGPMANHVRRASGRVNELAERLDRLGFEGLVSEVSGYARRRPGRFLLYSAAAGVLAGRLGRNMRAAQGDGSAPQQLQPRPEDGGRDG